jgi:hypothetical protein
MTRDDIIRMAREAGLIKDWMVLRNEDSDALARFAALVAAAEREACAKVCEEMWGRGYRDDGSDQWMGHDNAVQSCLAAIRARGQA